MWGMQKLVVLRELTRPEIYFKSWSSFFPEADKWQARQDAHLSSLCKDFINPHWNKRWDGPPCPDPAFINNNMKPLRQGLFAKREELLVITAEECGELTQECMKLLRFDKNTPERLTKEAGDCLQMIKLLVEHGVIDEKELNEASEAKREKLKEWSSLFIDYDDTDLVHGV